MVNKDDEHFVACVTEIVRGELVWRWAEDGNFSSRNTEVYVEQPSRPRRQKREIGTGGQFTCHQDPDGIEIIGNCQVHESRHL